MDDKAWKDIMNVRKADRFLKNYRTKIDNSHVSYVYIYIK